MIPLKLETLLDGRVVEQDRVEYKRGWNPTDTIQTICAYANDFPNMNGGYIVIGIEADNGRPLLPPVGVDEDDLDRIQKELFQYCNLIEPRYLPKLEIVEYKGKKIIYVWCSAGDAGPYSAPVDVLSKNREDRRKEYWIKPFSIKTIANHSEKFELFGKFDSMPFDDRVNRDAKTSDIQLGHIRDFLVEGNSALADDVYSRSMEDTLLSMEVANKTDVGVDLRNIALLMFSDYPEKFMPGAQIELVWFHSPEEEGSDDFTEVAFKGPLFRQVKEALRYIKSQLIIEKVVKVPGRAEADRFFTYPYEALEEALANACQHKSFQIPESVEIRLYLDRIMIINYPGPELWIDMDEFREGKAVPRRYRNRRIGEFFKEIDLAEKKSTGITKILRSLEKNGSPPPSFKTDMERHYLQTTIWIHEGFKPEEVSGKMRGNGNTENDPNRDPNDPNRDPNETNTFRAENDFETKVKELIVCNDKITYDEMAERIGISRATFRRRFQGMREAGIVQRVGGTRGHWEITSGKVEV